jgi:uncharacterized membrane protein
MKPNSHDKSRRIALGVSLFAAIVVILPVIINSLGGIDTSGCSVEDGCRTSWNLLGAWLIASALSVIAAGVCWLVCLSSYLRQRRERDSGEVSPPS